MRVTIAGAGRAGAVVLCLGLWGSQSHAQESAIAAASRKCLADMRALKIYDRAPFTRCITRYQRTRYIAKFGDRDLDLLDVYIAQMIAAADQFDRGRLTEAQYGVEAAKADSNYQDGVQARTRARLDGIDRRYERRLDAIDRRYASPSNAWQDQPARQLPAPALQQAPAAAWPGAPRTFDCSVTPGSLGRSVGCW